jgi:hypothetical protein
MQKSSGFSIGNLVESEWRISADFQVVAQHGFLHGLMLAAGGADYRFAAR